MIHLQIEEGYGSPGVEEVLRRAAEAALEHQGRKSASMTIVLTGDEQIRQLNRDYLDEDAATDVLSFPSDEKKPGGKPGYLGDIVISSPKAAEQAKAGGHKVEEELQLLTVHAVLHLLGYDHAEVREKEKMWEVQGEVLRKMGIEVRENEE